MKNQFSLEISQPCSENFNQFTPTLKGGFCDSCKTEVIDFSKMNSEEITNYFNNRSSKDLCGRFNTNQLKTYTENSNSRKKYSFWSGVALACLSIFSFNTAQAQTEIIGKPLVNPTQNQEKKFKVKGTVVDEMGPFADINVVLQGTTIGTVTDFDGYFEFPEPLKKGDVLVFSQIGMESKKVVIDDSSKLNIELKVNMKSTTCILMGKVAVKKVYKSKRKN